MEEAPIKEMLKKFKRKRKYLFCMPAHKGTENRKDITELSFSDNLHNPTGVIKKSQDLTAKVFGAKKCFYVTAGSTASVFIMLLAVKNFGSKIIINRCSHKSVYNALAVFNVEPVIVDDFDNIEKLLTNDVIGALITYPDYFGNCVDIKKISDVLKSHNKLLLSDSSHGGHFNEKFGLINPNLYCDICCISSFKTLSGLTQGSFLLLNNLSLENNIKNSFNLIHTTSPSYLILESLESAALDLKRQTNLDRIKKHINYLKEKTGLNFEDNTDPLKLIINVENLKISGHTLEKFLNGLNVYPEFSTFTKVVFIISYWEKRKNFKKLSDALIKLKTQKFPTEEIIKIDFKFEKRLSYIEAVNGSSGFIDAKNSAGKISAGNLGIYPPAVPLITAGEVITKEFADFMLQNIDRFFGVISGKIKVVK